MNMKFFATSILLVIVAVLTGCSSNESPEDETIEIVPLTLLSEAIADPSVVTVEKEELPVWLSDYIDSLKPDNFRDVAAFHAKWKGEDVYYVHDAFSSCLLCATFHSNGEKINWSEINPAEFFKSAADWKIIYLSKSKIHDI